MALHPDFPSSPHAVLDPALRWFPADETLRGGSMEKLMPPLVSNLRRKVKEFRDSGYAGACETSKSLLNWWFKEKHLVPQADGGMAEFQYFFAQREIVFRDITSNEVNSPKKLSIISVCCQYLSMDFRWLRIRTSP